MHMNPFRIWLIQRGLSQRAAADALGVSNPEINRYCRDDFWPRKEVALRIFNFTGGEITPNDLIDDELAAMYLTVADSAEHKAAQAMIEQRERARKIRAERKAKRIASHART